MNTLLEDIREECVKTRYLIPLFPCLSEPVGPLVKIFSKNIKDTVYSVGTAVGANGTIVMSAFADSLIKIYELETGMSLYCIHNQKRTCYSKPAAGLFPGNHQTDSRVFSYRLAWVTYLLIYVSFITVIANLLTVGFSSHV